MKTLVGILMLICVALFVIAIITEDTNFIISTGILTVYFQNFFQNGSEQKSD